MAARNRKARSMTLSQRIAALTGPDRAVEAEVMFDLYAKPVGKSKIDGGPRGYLWPEDNPSWSFGLRFPGKNREWFEEQRRGGDGERLLIERDGALVLMNDLRVPRLTASLDAAMSVVPADAKVILQNFGDIGGRSMALVGPNNGFVSGTTPALALLAAAIKARGL